MADSSDNPSPTLRERQTERVRQELRSAFVALSIERGVHAFSLHDVAVAAGVSDRTLYRYYPNREAFIDEIQSHALAVIEGAKRDRGGDAQDGFDSPGSVARAFEVFEEHGDLVRASALIRESGLADRDHDARTAYAWKFIEDAGVHPDAVDALATLARMLTGSDGWMRMTSPEFGLTSREAGLAAQWAVQTLIEAARAERGPLRPTVESGTADESETADEGEGVEDAAGDDPAT